MKCPNCKYFIGCDKVRSGCDFCESYEPHPEIIEQLQAENKELHKALNDQLPHTMIACPNCGLYGIRASKQNMCDKCKIQQLQDERAQMRQVLKRISDMSRINGGRVAPSLAKDTIERLPNDS